MLSSAEVLGKWSDRLAGAGSISSRRMMGEYLVYADGKLVGGIYDDRMLLKITKSSSTMLASAEPAFPYEGAGEMILVPDDVDDRLLCDTVRAMIPELPEKKKRVPRS